MGVDERLLLYKWVNQVTATKESCSVVGRALAPLRRTFLVLLELGMETALSLDQATGPFISLL